MPFGTDLDDNGDIFTSRPRALIILPPVADIPWSSRFHDGGINQFLNLYLDRFSRQKVGFAQEFLYFCAATPLARETGGRLGDLPLKFLNWETGSQYFPRYWEHATAQQWPLRLITASFS